MSCGTVKGAWPAMRRAVLLTGQLRSFASFLRVMFLRASSARTVAAVCSLGSAPPWSISGTLAPGLHQIKPNEWDFIHAASHRRHRETLSRVMLVRLTFAAIR